LLDREAEKAWIATRTVAKTETIQIGAERVELEHVGPAHTDNDLVVFIPGRNILHTGDVVFHRLFPFVDAQGGASVDGWIAACDRLLRIADRDTVVVPGHGEVTDRNGISEQRAFLVALRDFVAKQIKEGRTADEVEAMSIPGYEKYGFRQMQ